jgi:tetratricopeptide (TPR) repeat protein
MSDAVTAELAKALAAYRTGDLSAAERIVESLRDTHPDRADVLTAHGVILASRGQWEPAFGALQAALRKTPNNPEALAWAATAALQLRRFAEAEQLSLRFGAILPNNPRAHYLQAKALEGLGRIEEAIRAVDRALELQPEDDEALLAKARLLRQWRLPGLAIEFYRRAMAVRPSPGAAVDLAQIWLREGRPAAALEVLESVLAVTPEAIRPYDLIAQAQTTLGRDEEAEQSWRLAQKNASEPASVVERRAWTEIAVGRFDAASERLNDLLEGHPERIHAFYLLTTAKKMSDADHPLIARMVDRAEQGELDDRVAAELQFALGRSFDQLADYERAMAHFNHANRINYRLFRELQPGALSKEDLRRYADAQIAYFTPERIRAARPAGVPSALPLFVVGLPRTGTTLTSQILTSHSAIVGGDEYSFWPTRTIECVTQSLERIEVHWDAVSRLSGEYLTLLRSEDPSARYAVDKMPSNFQLSALLHCALPNARIVHLRRNLVAAALSIWMTPFALEQSYTSDSVYLVEACREHLRLLDHFCSVLPADRFASFRYEDLTENPDSTIRAMFDFLELEPEAACFQPESNTRSVLTPSVSQVREPIHRRARERWRNYLPWLGDLTALLEIEEAYSSNSSANSPSQGS